jgi:hypothetical protein
MAKQNPDMEKPNRDFIVAGLDVIISLAEGLGPGFESLIANSNLIGMIIPLAKVPLKQNSTTVITLKSVLFQSLNSNIFQMKCVGYIFPDSTIHFRFDWYLTH